MPFNKLASFRKVHSLDAEVHGAALCGVESMVTMVSSDPTRLATLSTAGANAKTVNLSLGGATDVALFNRHAAIVRGTDFVAWNLLDLTNKVKIDEAARDVKLLRGCPAGGAALGVGWDGNGIHFTAAKTDVEARNFAVRGDIRCFDLTDRECWVVVDGGSEGSQLRVHPGQTPEPGAVLRANLPDEAKGLDRLRASPRLAVLYKPGQMSACIATGAPNVLRARMIRLEGKPVDLAVMETSLFALYDDGRVALYDSDAINASASGDLVAKHEMPVGGGPPRILMTVVKGPAMLWVGTARGEIMMANVGRKTG